ncbi:hypothetical protein BXZ70DRAFT_729538 [Cristinia sonorae]|uniref:F-box domain-containing protein n=1 Tax=Cristinia sonorae TaxID=1940300 RepID=A0A8K0UTB0_9AGAR|nr:hypothetical protein BXZ70DRAFT_729538 [Cristinia sonorae]
MHPCLKIYDVVAEVLHYLSNGVDEMSETVQGAGHVIRMAQTCSTLYEPCMNVLWRRLFDLHPIVKCLPDEMWYESDNVVHLRREPTPEESSRMLAAANRVKVIRKAYNRHAITRVSGPTIRLLRAFCDRNGHTDRGRSFLSNLHDFCWDGEVYSLDALSNISFLLPHRLQTLELSTSPHYTKSHLAIARNAYAAFLERCPGLRELIVHSMLARAEQLCIDVFGRAAGAFSVDSENPCQQTFHINVPAEEDVLERLVHFQHIQHASLGMHPKVAEKSLKSVEAHSLLPLLKTLMVFRAKISVCNLIFDSLASRSLTSILLEDISSSITGVQFRQLCQKLSFHADLRRVEVTKKNTMTVQMTQLRSQNAAYSVHSSSIRPLLTLQHLTEVILKPSTVTIDLTDKDIDAMSLAWPHLRTLTVTSDLYMQQKPGVTLGGLFPLGRRCLKLERLDLAVDMVVPSKELRDEMQKIMDAVDADPTGPEAQRQSRLTKFNIAYGSPLDEDNDDKIAVFLRDLFPCLKAKGFGLVPMCDHGQSELTRQWRKFKWTYGIFCEPLKRRDNRDSVWPSPGAWTGLGNS